MADQPLSSTATGSHLDGRSLGNSGNVDQAAEWKWWDNVVPELGKAFNAIVGAPAPAPAGPVDDYVPTTELREPAPVATGSGPVSATIPAPPQHVEVVATPARAPPPPPPRPDTPAKTPTAKTHTAVNTADASAFRSKRIGNTAADPTGHNSMGLEGWKEGDAIGGHHINANLLGYSAEDYLHSRDQLVSLIERGLKPPPSLFTQLEACAHKMSPEDLREEYKWFVSTYLSEDSSLQLKGACEMLVIRIGEIVSMPRAARLAKKQTDKRLTEAGVTPRVEEVRDDDLDVGRGGEDYRTYVELRTKAMEARKKGKTVAGGDYAEIDLRLYTLPGADMITEYKFLADLYLKYEFSEVPADLFVRGFCELRLMRLGELLYMPLPVRIAAAKADVVLSQADSKLPNIVSGSLSRTGVGEYVPPSFDDRLMAPPDQAAYTEALITKKSVPPPSTSEVFLTPARASAAPAAQKEQAAKILNQAALMAQAPPPRTGGGAAAALAPPKIVAPPPVPSPSRQKKKDIRTADASAHTPSRDMPGSTPGQSTKMPASLPYIHGAMPSVNMDMLKDIAILGGNPIQDPLPAQNRQMPTKGQWSSGGADAAAAIAAENTTRSSVPNWLKKLRTRENLGGRRRDADQMRLLDLAAEAASQAAFHGAASAAVGALDGGSVIETEGTDASPQRPKYEEPSHFQAKDQLIGELRNFLGGSAGGAAAGGGAVRSKLKAVSDNDKKGWFMREADRLRLAQISKHENRIDAIEKLERDRGMSGGLDFSTSGNAAGARAGLGGKQPLEKPSVFGDALQA